MSVVGLAGDGLILIGLLAVAWAPAPQSDGNATIEERFQKLDLDRNGKLDAAEAEPARDWLGGADADHDGFYTLDEVLAHGASLAAARSVPARPPQLDPREAAAQVSPGSPREGPVKLSPDEHLIGNKPVDFLIIDEEDFERSQRGPKEAPPSGLT